MQILDKAKKHLHENKKLYIGYALGLATTVTLVSISQRATKESSISQKLTQVGFVNKGVQVQFVENSTPSKPIHLVGTKQYFNSISAAARETGLSRELISRNVGGYIPDVKGKVFEVVDVSN